MAGPSLYDVCEMQIKLTVRMTVYFNAVKLEEIDTGRAQIVGWFSDEVCAISAMAERSLMRSAIISTLRRLPELTVICEYRQAYSDAKVVKFRRATRVKCAVNGRKIVRVPGTFGKIWI